MGVGLGLLFLSLLLGASSVAANPPGKVVVVVKSYGFIDTSGAELIPISGRFVDARPFANGLAKVKIADGYWGFIDTTGALAIAAVYSAEPSDFNDGFARLAASEEDEYGYAHRVWTGQCIDRAGTAADCLKGESDSLATESARPVQPGVELAAVIDTTTGLYGYVDADQRLKIPYQFDYADRFADGLAVVCRDEKCGYIDRQGDVVLPLIFHSARRFSGGIAVVQTYKPPDDGKVKIVTCGLPSSDGRPLYEYIRKDGTRVGNDRYLYAASFSEGYAVVGSYAYKWGDGDRRRPNR